MYIYVYILGFVYFCDFLDIVPMVNHHYTTFWEMFLVVPSILEQIQVYFTYIYHHLP